MTNTVRMKLVFRLGGIGFALRVQDLIEIREDPGGILDRCGGGPGTIQLGRLMHRGETVPVIDLGRCMGLPVSPNGSIVLILSGESGIWGIAVDRVEGIFPESDFEFRPLPVLLGSNDSFPYAGVEIWRDEPLVLCEARRLEDCWCDHEC